MPEKVIPLGSEEKVQFGFKVEASINQLIDNLANRGQDYTDKKGNEVKFEEAYENYPEDLPKSKVGVILHYVLRGIKEDMGIEFDATPYSMRDRASTSSERNGERFSKEKKNDILARCSASYYTDMDIEEIFEGIRVAMEEKKYWENEGYVLVPEKTKPPMKKDSKKYMEYLQAKDALKAAAQERGAALGARAKQAKAAAKGS